MEKKRRKRGRPWDGHTKVKRTARSVRFPPEDFELLVKAAVNVDEKVEAFIKKAVQERVLKVLK